MTDDKSTGERFLEAMTIVLILSLIALCLLLAIANL